MLTTRQERILCRVVDDYLQTGQPVASKTIAADALLECGPSTVRNELALLEEVGLLAHPHVSSGRVPTDAGHEWGRAAFTAAAARAANAHDAALKAIHPLRPDVKSGIWIPAAAPTSIGPSNERSAVNTTTLAITTIGSGVTNTPFVSGTLRCLLKLIATHRTTKGTNPGQPSSSASHAPTAKAAAVRIAVNTARRRGKGLTALSLSAVVCRTGARRQGRGPEPVLAPNPSATGEQDRNDPTTECSRTDSNLLHRKFPLASPPSQSLPATGHPAPLRVLAVVK